MSDDLDIRGGGAVAVDTTTLRATADRFESLAVELDEIAALVGSAALRLFALSRDAWEASSAAEGARRRIVVVSDDAHGLTAGLRDAAAVYEIVELRAERAAAEAAGDSAAVARIDARLDALFLAHPGAERRATLGALGHWFAWPGELARQASGALWWLTPGFHALAVPTAWALQRAVGALGAGTVPSGARLDGRPGEVIVSPVAVRGPATAPTSLAGAAERIPHGDARIRVERYTMPDGSRQFAVYVAGTQTLAPRTREPFDMGSGVELYAGEHAASYDATLAALRQAGAEPGDVVHAFGHSQGAMVTAHLALEGGFDTQHTRLVRLARRSRCRRRHPQYRAAARRRSGRRSGGRGARGDRGGPWQFHRGADGRPADRPARLRHAGSRNRSVHADGETAGCLGRRPHGCCASGLRRLRRCRNGRGHRVRGRARPAGSAAATGACGQSFFLGRRMIPNTQLMSEMMIAATTPHQKSSTRRPQLQKLVIQAVSHSRNALMMSPIRPSVRM